jgi:hypothetical protein
MRPAIGTPRRLGVPAPPRRDRAGLPHAQPAWLGRQHRQQCRPTTTIWARITAGGDVYVLPCGPVTLELTATEPSRDTPGHTIRG